MLRVLAATFAFLLLAAPTCIAPDPVTRFNDAGREVNVAGRDAGRESSHAERDAGPEVDAAVRATCPTSTSAQRAVRPAAGSRAPFEFQLEGQRRTFVVHVPAGYDGSAPVPLLFATHGVGKLADEFARDSNLLRVADAAGFVAIFADQSGLTWNVGSTTDTVDDVAFFRAMITFARDALGLCIDPARTYAAGLSNGAMMTYRLACEASDVFAAVASVAGSLRLEASACAAAQTRPVPLLEIHGNGDPFVTFEVVEQDFAEYAAITGCGASSRVASQPASRLDTTCTTRNGCPSGVEVTLCKVERGAHCWYGGTSCGGGVPGGAEPFGRNAEGIVAADAVWAFVSRFSCPTCGR